MLQHLRRTQKQTAGVAGGHALQAKLAALTVAKADALPDPLADAQTPVLADAKANALSDAKSPVASSFLLLASGFSSSPQNSDLSFEGARELLTFLNEKASADFRESPAVLQEIALRLHEVGGDLEGVRTMVTRQCALWKSDPKMSRFLRPTTLFDSVKFHEYFGQRNIPVQASDAQPDGSVRVNAAAVNGRLMIITRRLAEIEDSPLPDQMSERRALKREQAVLTEQQRKAAGL